MLRFQIETSVAKRGDLLCLDAISSGSDSEHPRLSRAQLKKLIQSGQVLVEGRGRAASSFQASEILGPGAFSFLIPEAVLHVSREAAVAPDEFTLPILFESEALLVLNKSSGVPSVPHSAHETESAVNFALRVAPAIRHVGRGGLEPGILHRLDTGTSGVLIFAKTEEAFLHLQHAWKARGVRKIYRALVRPHSQNQVSLASRNPPEAGDEIRWPLGHDLKSAKKMLAIIDPERDLKRVREEPQPALTRVLHWIRVQEASGLTDACVEIETGVMHQIRVHLKSLGYPIQGDSIYQGVPSRRLWLHAWKLVVPALPGILETPLTLEAPLPEGWPVHKIEKAR